MPHASPETRYPRASPVAASSADAQDSPQAAEQTPTVATPAEPPAPRRTRRPRARRELGTAWLVLAGLLAIATLPLGIELTRPGLFTTEEARAHGTALETWQRREGFSAADRSLETWVPVYLGRLRMDQPPGTAWVHVLAISKGKQPPTGITAKANLRWAGVVMALFLIASVFWAGHSVGGMMTGLLSALAAMSMPTLLFFGRLAVPETITAAWAALAMATALWAMRPLRRNPSLARQFIGWLLCGLATGMATMTGGGAALPVVLVPILAIALSCPYRIGHTLGLIAATAIAALTITPWAIYVHEAAPDGWGLWLDPFAQHPGASSWAGYGASALWRLLAGVALMGVWAVWLLPAVMQPFSSSTGQARRRMLLGWTWMVSAAAVVFLMPGPTRAASLMVLAAPASLALGQVMRRFHDLSAEGHHASFWNAGKWVTLGYTVLLSLALPVWAGFETQMPDWVNTVTGRGGPYFASMGLWFWIGAAVVLGLLSALGARFALTNHPGRAYAAWAAWVLAAATLMAIPLARGPAMNAPATPPLSATP
jgi:4-amino-4-deoxy-L-arabinose transferase-like glycosyltransferase